MKKIGKDTVLSQIVECFEKHDVVNRTIFNKDQDYCSGKTVYNKFGSFSKACEKAGVPHSDKPQKKQKVEIECLSCGNIRKVYPYRARDDFPDGTSQTCKQCMNKKQKVSCEWCGNELTKHNYQVQRNENCFCNQECSGQWRSKNIVGENHPRYDEKSTKRYGENWSYIREKVIKRDSEVCQSCGISREKHLTVKNIDLDVHHIKPRKEFIENNMSIDEANEMDNLETLCRSCHMNKEWS